MMKNTGVLALLRIFLFSEPYFKFCLRLIVHSRTQYFQDTLSLIVGRSEISKVTVKPPLLIRILVAFTESSDKKNDFLVSIDVPHSEQRSEPF